MKNPNLRLTTVKLKNHNGEELSTCGMCKGRGAGMQKIEGALL